jgi:hypothetical protein
MVCYDHHGKARQSLLKSSKASPQKLHLKSFLTGAARPWRAGPHSPSMSEESCTLKERVVWYTAAVAKQDAVRKTNEGTPQHGGFSTVQSLLNYIFKYSGVAGRCRQPLRRVPQALFTASEDTVHYIWVLAMLRFRNQQMWRSLALTCCTSKTRSDKRSTQSFSKQTRRWSNS